MSVLVDTNVLLRRMQPGHSQYHAAVESLAWLGESGEPGHFTLQNVSELWNVATRPVVNNGLGFTISTVLDEIDRIEQLLTLLPDTGATYAEWKSLITQHNVTGVKVHDARLAAIMRVYRVDRLLTFNTADFGRYGFEVVHPASMQAAGN